MGVGLTTVLPDFDWETYSEAGLVFDPDEMKWDPLPGLSGQQRGLKGCGVRNYIQHPSFRILSLAWDLKDGKGKRWWRPDDGTTAELAHVYCEPDDLKAHVAAGLLLEAWNSSFEWQVWEFYCVPVLGWPRLHLSQMRCAMAKAKVAGYPAALKNAGEVLNLVEQKDPAGEALVRKLTMPRKPTKKNPATRWTPQALPLDFGKFYAYNIQDIKAEAEASLRVPDLTPYELRVWQMDQRINMRGMQIDTLGVEDCIAIVEQVRAREHAKLFRLTGGRVSKSTEVTETLRWMASRGVTLYGLDEEDVEAALARTDYPADVLQVLKIRQALAFGSVNKLFKMRAQTTPGGRLIDQYGYASAHTKLWNSYGVQVANLYKGIFDKPEKAAAARAAIATRSLEYVEYMYPGYDALEIIASYLRSLIIAAPGHRLISADFTAIQAVITSALAREEWRLEVFRTHGKIYEAMAAQMTGNTLQFYLDYKKQNGAHHSDRQDYGKIPTLSGDFGAWIKGWKRFGADKVLGPDENIKAAILKNRARQPNIVELWGGQTRNKFNKAPDGSYAQEYQEFYGLEGAAMKAVLEPGTCYAYNGVRYQMHEDILYSAGPSGGLMYFHAPRLARSTRDYARPWELELSYEGWNSNATKGKAGWQRMKLYGGVLTQNIVSHEAREIQAAALLALDEPGDYPIVMHTHDEGVAEVPYGRGSAAEYTQRARASLPSWAVTPDGKPWPVKLPDAWECEVNGKWED